MTIRCTLNGKLVLPEELHVYIGADIVRRCKKPQGIQRLIDYYSAQINMSLGNDDEAPLARDRLNKSYPEIVISD